MALYALSRFFQMKSFFIASLFIDKGKEKATHSSSGLGNFAQPTFHQMPNTTVKYMQALVTLCSYPPAPIHTWTLQNNFRHLLFGAHTLQWPNNTIRTWLKGRIPNVKLHSQPLSLSRKKKLNYTVWQVHALITFWSPLSLHPPKDLILQLNMFK